MGKIQGTETKSEGENDDLKLDKFQEQVLQKLQTIQTTENIHETAGTVQATIQEGRKGGTKGLGPNAFSRGSRLIMQT